MLLLLTDFEKGFVRQHTRKTGTVVQAHFTKRLPGKVQEKHTREKFYDHDKTSAKKAHEELEAKKAKHQFLLEATQKHHDELKKQGPKEDEKGLTHKEKLSHLQSEISNQQTHIDNHSRKQDHIKNRYQISSKQIVRKKSKADLEKRITDHSDEQKNTIRSIHKAHQEGKSNLEPGKVLTGKDKDHIYLETKHKDTGKAYHLAIHKDGSVNDPNVLHGGKFDSGSLKEHRKEKEVVVKKPVERKGEFSSPPESAQETFPRKATIDQFTEQAKEKGIKVDKGFTFKLGDVKNRIYRVEGEDESGNKLAYSYVKGEKGKTPIVIPREPKKPEPEKPKREPKKVIIKKSVEKETLKSEAEEKENRSRAMIGNKNAYKGGPEDDQITKTLKQELKNDPVLKGMAISTDLIKSGTADLIERSVKNPAEMAAIAQVFRDPRYETHRFVLTKNNKINAHLAVTSKMPSKTLLAPGKQFETLPSTWLNRKMKEHGSDGYYMIHNHPSGDPTPSEADLRATKSLNENSPGFKGHIIINSNKYTDVFLDRDKGEAYYSESDINKGAKDKLLTPSLDHPLLGKSINNQDALAAISKDLQNTDKYFTLIGADNKLKTRTIHEMPMDMAKYTPESRRAFESFLRTHTEETGANHYFIAGLPNNAVTRKFLANAEHHGLITDASFDDNKILSDMQMETSKSIDRDQKNFSDLPKQELTGYLTEEKKREPKKVVVKKPVEKESPKSAAEEKKNRSEAMKGNKNAWKGGPKEDEKPAIKKPAVAAFTKTKSQLDKAIEKHRTGKETMVITARSKDKHKVRYKVIEADDKRLVASNDIDGKINKDYPSLDVKGALQMRDRSNIQSKAQINQMSNDLEPMFLTDSKIASDGAPIVGGDYAGKEGHSVVESGNGRVMAIRTAYENGKADHYKKHLVEEAESFGIDPKTIKGMKNPILIRERVDKMSDQEKAKFAKESNKATVSQMTAVEQAIEDSNYLGQLTNLKATDSGRITHKNNSQFIKDFFSQVMDNDPREVGKLLNKDGQLNDEGERRLTNAVFTRVYGSHSDVMNKLIMKDTDKTKKITAGMLAAAPRMAQFKQTMLENDRHDLDISGNFIDALAAMEDLKRAGISLEEKLQTVDWADLGVKEDYKDPLKNPDVVDILKMIQEHGTGLTGSANKISSLLINYADEAEKSIHAEDPNKLTIDDAMGIARDKQMKVTKGEILKQAKDEVSFLQADRKGKKESYQKYLDEYPTGKFSAEAKEKLSRLSKPEEPGKNQGSF